MRSVFQASSKSTFYVLHDWSVGGGVYSLDTTNSAFPADRVSDVMLKSMGILRVRLRANGNMTFMSIKFLEIY